jgi:tetratricopeptide (TPR) repeat protein
MAVHDTPFLRIQQRLACGDLITASQEIEHWLSLQPHDAGALTTCAHLLRLRGHYQDAAAMLGRSLAVAPRFAPALVEMARLARIQGQLKRAHELWEQAWRIEPEAGDWMGEWVELLQHLQNHPLTARIAEAWCELRPDLPDSWFQLALAHQQNGSTSSALDAYRRVLALNADYPMLRNNLAALHYSMQDYQIALRFCEDAIRANASNHLAWTNAAAIWLKLREPGFACIAAERACALAPNYLTALMTLINALKELQRPDEALDIALRASQFAPADTTVQWALAMLQLQRGDYRNGWANHEARWAGSPELSGAKRLDPDRQWRGEDLTGRTLFVWGEQGFGDALQFARFIPEVARRVQERGKLIYCAFAPLFELFERSLSDHEVDVVPHDTVRLPDFDFHIPVGSLPLALGVTLDNLPAPSSYVVTDARRTAYWREKLQRGSGLKVGLVWSGSRTHQRNPLRSVPPALYARAFGSLSGVEFYSLQVDGADEVAAMASDGLEVIDWTKEFQSFDESAALVCNLDLVITVCTSVAHLSGALGVPTWLLLDVNPHWVWMLERDDSPWYPSIRIYRQQRYGDWLPVLEQVKAELMAMNS